MVLIDFVEAHVIMAWILPELEEVTPMRISEVDPLFTIIVAEAVLVDALIVYNVEVATLVGVIFTSF